MIKTYVWPFPPRIKTIYWHVNREFHVPKYICRKVKIVDVVKKYINLDKYSNNYFIGDCPFEECKKPGFKVDHKRRIFICYECRKTGDVIDFLRCMLKLRNHELHEYIMQNYRKDLLKPKQHFLEKYFIEYGIRLYNFYKILSTPLPEGFMKNFKNRKILPKTSGITLTLKRSVLPAAEKIINKKVDE